MKIYFFILLSFLSQTTISQPEKHRLVILADMGNEPDEVQQMVHMMMYSNEFDLEALVAVTGKYLNPQEERPYRRVLHPELFHEIIDGFELVRPNLLKHAQGWPEASYLRSIVANGQTDYGIEGTGPGKSTEGSELIINSFRKADPRPIYIVVNAGSNTLAQALIDFENNHTELELSAVLRNLRVFENGAQDNAGAWICARYPDIQWIRSNFQTYCYGGPSWDSEQGHDGASTRIGPHTWEPFEYSSMGQHHWALTHIIGDHGFLGKIYPLRQTHAGKIVYLEGGGTIPWLGLVHRGLTSLEHPHWGGWSGRYSKEKVKNAWSRHESVKVDEEKYDDFAVYIDVADQWTDPDSKLEYNNTYTPVWRWRRACFNDFKCRMDWCIAPYEKANHAPVAAINGNKEEIIHILAAEPGEVITLDASASSDPDNDALAYNWWAYPEAGTYKNEISIDLENNAITTYTIPSDASGTEIHLILQVNDINEIANLYDYRRLVIQVK
jgi:hypothetical protein